MKNPSIAWGIWAAILVSVSVCKAPVEAATKVEKPQAAAKLVEEVLQREAREGIDDRQALLRPALVQSPVYDAAWWQSGFLFDLKWKEWLRWDEVPARAAKDESLAEYRKMRGKYAETVDGQVALARWCAKHKLEEQARAHWTRVLEFDPDQAEARKGLGFRKLDGRWVGDHDISQTQGAARKASATAATWISRLQKIRDRLADENAAKRKKAIADLMALRDPAAADAIDVVFCRATNELALQGIDALKNIHGPETAKVLAWHAIFSAWPEVRQAAAAALQSQEKYDFVPLLLALAESSPGTATQDTGGTSALNTSTNARNSLARPQVRTVFRLDHEVSTYSWITVEQLKVHPYWWTIPNMRYNSLSPDPVTKTTTKSGNLGGANYNSQQKEFFSVSNGRLQDRFTQNNVKVDRQKLTPVGQIVYPPNTSAVRGQTQNGASPHDSEPAPKTPPGTVLAEATAENPRSVSQWWDWWYDYNEVYQSSAGGARLAGDKGVQPQRGDCLAVGTLVLTELGLKKVENIAIGDRVFCCDTETGRVALKSILRKTIRPEGRLLRIRAGGEQFQTSSGHVFWVAGQGWTKARDLRKGMQLHTIRGTVELEDTAPGDLQTTIGLVADDFHTFFIGKQKVLTHDNTIRPPTDRIVPGLSGKAVRAP
jgi:hypothetical protein